MGEIKLKNGKPELEHKNGWFTKFLNITERLGNKLPDPFMLFVYLSVIVILLSWFLNSLGSSVVHPGSGEELPIKSLVSGEGIQFIFGSMLDNFTGFSPLGLVLVVMLGIGLAEKVGLFETAIRKTILSAPKKLITISIVFVAINSNIASEAASVVIPPLAAMVFYSIGRNPIVGLVASFASLGAGFTANLLVVGTDALLAGITTEAVRAIDDKLIVTPVDNWYFGIVSVVMLTIIGTLITDKLIEPRLGEYSGDYVLKENNKEHPKAGEALRNAVIAGAVYIIILGTLVFWPNSPMKNENGGLIPSPFLDSIVPILLMFFITIGCAFGITIGKIKSSKDMTNLMTESMKDMGGYIVLVFSISQFISFFNWTNIGTWLAVNGADLLVELDFTGIPVIILYTILTAFMEFFITSGSAKWALEAPIFIPMFMELGYHPAFIQAAYRIADSSFNIITPLSAAFVIVLGFLKQYDKKAGIGTLMSLLMPYSLIFLGSWIVLLLIFYFLGIPFGPGVGAHL
ncbi:AbgT family transporter [Metabacillus arenae]|uniref:AbgT family transporter n=1 Tax=Metabacillus arenae TaxID=2771434 RepID=A0A926NPI4_9BACI|nr:AbgT family transporter [Metabacillus arenae]MBD1381702.1 AbgT family transporter [Metabacillus arenae]